MWAKGSFSLFTFSHTNNNSFRPFSKELFQCLSLVCCRPVGTGHGHPSLSQTEIKTATEPPAKRKQQCRTAASPAPGCYKPRALQPPKALQSAWFANAKEDASSSSWAERAVLTSPRREHRHRRLCQVPPTQALTQHSPALPRSQSRSSLTPGPRGSLL